MSGRGTWKPSAPQTKSAGVAELIRGGRGRNRHVNPIDIALIVATLLLFSRVWTPWGEPAVGQLVRRVPLSLLGRLRMHGPPALTLLALSIVSLILGLVGPQTVLIVAGLLVLLLVAPMVYTVTSRGIRPGRTPFRRWTEFGGVARRPGGVRLQGVAGARPQTVWLSGGRDDDEFVLLLRQMVRGSYKGVLGPEAGLVIPESAAAGASTGPIGIAGAGGH